MNQKLDIKFSLIVAVIIFIAFSRMIPHMPNYSPMTAIALFGIAHLDKKWLAVMVIFIATFLSDLVLNNTIYANSIIAIKQLYMTYAPADWVEFTVGNFSTFFGYELIEPQNNFNYSTSLAFKMVRFIILV